MRNRGSLAGLGVVSAGGEAAGWGPGQRDSCQPFARPCQERGCGDGALEALPVALPMAVPEGGRLCRCAARYRWPSRICPSPGRRSGRVPGHRPLRAPLGAAPGLLAQQLASPHRGGAHNPQCAVKTLASIFERDLTSYMNSSVWKAGCKKQSRFF